MGPWTVNGSTGWLIPAAILPHIHALYYALELWYGQASRDFPIFQMIGTLEEVTMPQNGIYHVGIAALADAFSYNPQMRVINLSDNTFTETGARAMADVSIF